MNHKKLMEEDLRQAACYGDDTTLEELIQNGVNVNSKNDINGWTALHWAARRNNIRAVSILLNNGADPTSLTSKGDLPCSLTKSEKIQALLGQKISNKEQQSLPITPNYLRNPPFFYSFKSNSVRESEIISKDILIIKVRVADAIETDFIEVELPRSELTFEKLRGICCKELRIKEKYVLKIRKLPNTIVRHDKDVQRFTDFQELEIIYPKVNQKVFPTQTIQGTSFFSKEEEEYVWDETQG